MKHRFLYNNDGTFILGNALHGSRPLTVDDVYDYVDLVAGTQVTTFLICTNASMPYYRSSVERHLGEPRGDQAVPDAPAIERHVRMGEAIRRLDELGANIVALCLDRARRHGMEAFATMRVNDLHFNDPATFNPLTQGDFWLDHPRMCVGDHPGWNAEGALDFAHDEVRRYKLRMVEEICNRFDIDGLELDFMRMPVYFRHGQGQAHAPVMTDFVQRVRDALDRAGRLKRRRIELAVRVARSMEHCRWIGLDPTDWVRKGLVDMVTTSAFYIDDPELPVAQFRNDLDCDEAPVYVNIDRRIKRPEFSELRPHDMYRASAALAHDAGSNGIYLFNFFFAPPMDDPTAGRCRPNDDPDGIWQCPKALGPAQCLLHQLGSASSLRGTNKRYGLGTSVQEYGVAHPRQLPRTLAANNRTQLKLAIADDVAVLPPHHTTLLTRIAGHGPLSLRFNHAEPERLDLSAALAECPGEWPLGDGQRFDAWSIRPELLRHGDNLIDLCADCPAQLLQLDLLLAFTAR